MCATNDKFDVMWQHLELHNNELDIRGARDTDMEFMNYTREKVTSIARIMII